MVDFNSSSLMNSFDSEHEAFAESRVSQYVFVPVMDSYFEALDQHADTLEGDVKPPLVLLGPEGSGKSACLANWVAKRREHLHRDEFLFQHFVGCSTISMQLAHMLSRLAHKLKDKFGLREMKVPDTEEELRWSLNRFLTVASKKHFPARIVIVIDGVNRLNAEGAPDGSLHWLPTDLPPCVRFILSSVVKDRVVKNGLEQHDHRTYTEIRRRQCPQIMMGPLELGTKQRVINDFTTLNEGKLQLTETQCHKICTSDLTAGPMHLRALLQALRLSSKLTEYTVDQLLDSFLSCYSTADLLDRNLNICAEAIFGPNAVDDSENDDILGKIFSLVYVSRNGLTQDEIWGLIKMVTQIELMPAIKEKVMIVLTEFTMVVDSMYSFSHEIYRELVYDKYIRTSEGLIRWHHLMARYFGQLPPIARKLVALPYHLEVAGCWSKVKNCLTDIDMFQLWWTPPFKVDFTKYWVSLTKQIPTNHGANSLDCTKPALKKSGKKNHKRDTRIYNTSADDNDALILHSDGTTSVTGSERPSYDIVEEYVRSLDEYRTISHPSDEKVAHIVLLIADFLLDFGSHGREMAADVPSLLHPRLPVNDLFSLGVPYLIVRDERASLEYPPTDFFLNIFNYSDGTATDKSPQEQPECSTYFFSRWMWIQFPFIALKNCNDPDLQLFMRERPPSPKRLGNDIITTEFDAANTQDDSHAPFSFAMSSQHDRDSHTSKMSAHIMDNANPNSNNDGNDLRFLISSSAAFRKSFLKNENSMTSKFSKSWSANENAMKLPSLKFHRRASRSMRRLTPFDLRDETKAAADQVTQRIQSLQDEIESLRQEYDFVSQMKHGLDRELTELKAKFGELKNIELTLSQNDKALEDAIQREAKGRQKANSIINLSHNLKFLARMCERHPANVPSLISDVELKIQQDKFVIQEIEKRLWSHRFENLDLAVKRKEMSMLMKEGEKLCEDLTSYRIRTKERLEKQLYDEQRRLNQHRDLTEIMKSNTHAERLQRKSIFHSATKRRPDGTMSTARVQESSDQKKPEQSWEYIWSVINTRTGIEEPEVFFQRLNNGSMLKEQINALLKQSEEKNEKSKKDVILAEKELEDAKLAAAVTGIESTKEEENNLNKKQNELRHKRERAEAAEQTVQHLESGLQHIAQLLFLPLPVQDDFDVKDNFGNVYELQRVNELLKDIEQVLDTLLEESDKQQQQLQQQGHTHANSSSDTSRMHTANREGIQAPELHAYRSPELEAVLARYESPTVRLPRKLPSRTVDKDFINASNLNIKHPIDDIFDEDEVQDEKRTWDRAYIKAVSNKVVRQNRKDKSRLPRSNTNDDMVGASGNNLANSI